MKREKGWMLLCSIQLIFSMFFLVYAGVQNSFAGKVLNERKSEVGKAFVFEHYRENSETDEAEAELYLNAWMEERKQAASFITSCSLPDGRELLIGIGEAALQIFPIQGLEMDTAYPGNAIDGKEQKLFIRTPIKQIEYPLKDLPGKHNCMVVGKSAIELDNKIVLCISYEEYKEQFGRYYADEIWNNLCLLGEAEDAKEFITDMKKTGYQFIAKDRQTFIHDYWGKERDNGIFFQIFYVMVFLFILYSVFMNLELLMRRRAKEFAVQYLCGETSERIYLRVMSVLMIVFGTSLVVIKVCYTKLFSLLPYWEQSFRILVMIMLAAGILFAVRMKKLLKEENMGLYLKGMEGER